MLKKVIANTFFQILGKAVTASTTLLLTIIIGRSLGPAGYGEFTKIFVFIGYFYVLYDLGLNNIFVKFATEKTSKPESLFKVLLGLRLILSFTLSVCAVLIALALPYNLETQTGFSQNAKLGIIIASATIVTQALLTTVNALFQKNLRYNLAAIATAAGSLAILASAALVFFTSGNLFGYVFAYVVGGIFFAGVALFLVLKRFNFAPIPSFDFASSKSLVSASWPIGLGLILNLIYFRADVLILSYNRPPEEVGYYGLSYQFFEAFLTIPIFIANALYPILAKLYLDDKDRFKKEVKIYLLALTGISLVLVVALYVASYLIPPLFGSGFSPSQGALRMLAIGLPFFFISALLWHLLIIFDKQKLLPVIYGVGAAFNVAANIIFIPVFGFIAAATVTVASEILITFLLAATILVQRKLENVK